VEAELVLYGVFWTVLGGALFLFPRAFESRAARNHSGRIAELEAGAPEAHFEELRELKAYPPPAKPTTLRLLGAVVFLISAGVIIVSVF
jgi:hypothetical protein